MRFESRILATPEAISKLTEKVTDFLQSQEVGVQAAHSVALILEELLVNLGTHGNCRETPARIAVSVENDRVLGEIVDSGPPFDPRQAPIPDISAPLAERPIGGLGLHMVRRLSSAFDYARDNEENRIAFAVARS